MFSNLVGDPELNLHLPLESWEVATPNVYDSFPFLLPSVSVFHGWVSKLTTILLPGDLAFDWCFSAQVT